MSRRPALSSEPDRGATELEQVFVELGGLFASSSCPRSTRCCRFKQTGRTPYLFPVEGRRVLLGIARRGGKLPGQGAPGDCPLILKDGGCSIYADRPFGCRTFFCDDATLPEGNRRREVDALAKRLRTTSERLGEPELVPLTTILEQSFDREGRRRKG
jgi:Fe-S-cluster containining protein